MSAAIPDDLKDILDKKGIAHVATVTPAGTPRTSPMWYEWDGERVLLSHTTARAKYRDVTANPRIALSITDPDDPYRYIEIRGRVEVEDDPDKALIHRLAKKYMGRDRYPWDGPDDHRVIFKVTPERVAPSGG
ncbi:MAG: PPOX class F420-dependent oxidoreductase [Actinomycetota bacterium]|nr:PPOX class F420-dependent oxidoreductase [Actinomycetota bacterium]MDQ3956547.1 PPOX class F420-dependent oxidoreductase [Actinomycetota bacterium]